MTTAPRTSLTAPAIRTRLVALAVTAVVATGVVAYFLVTQPAIGLKTPSRAVGSITGLLVWASVATLAAVRLSRGGGGRLGTATVVLAVLAAIGSVALAGIHAAAHVGGWQTITVAVLGVAAAGLAFSLRRG